MELFHAGKEWTIFQKKNIALTGVWNFSLFVLFVGLISLRQILTETTLALRLGLIF